MKKLLSLLTATGLVASTTTSLVACTNPGEEPTDPVDKRIDLKDEIKITNLGALSELSDQIIWDTIDEVNDFQPGLSRHVDFVGEPTETSVLLRAKESSSLFKGEVLITYTVNGNLTTSTPLENNALKLVKVPDEDKTTGEIIINSKEGVEINYRWTREPQAWLGMQVSVENSGPGWTRFQITSNAVPGPAEYLYLAFYAEGFNDFNIEVWVPRI